MVFDDEIPCSGILVQNENESERVCSWRIFGRRTDSLLEIDLYYSCSHAFCVGNLYGCSEQRMFANRFIQSEKVI